MSRKPNRRRPNNNNRADKEKENEYNPQSAGNKKGGNDLSWHAKSDTLLNEAASIPWSWSSGRPIVLNGPYDAAPDVTGKYVLPGLFAMRTAITPGTGMIASDALNIAAQAIYTDIRRMLKSANQYEASDVMIYLTAIGEIRAFIGWMTRLYATTMLYSYRNAYLPDALLKLQGVNPDSFHNHALEFLSRANQLIAKAAQIYIPKGLDFLDRCSWEYANYYSEGDSIKDQIYMITPGLFRIFGLSSDADYKGGLFPHFMITGGSNWSYDVILDRFEDMIEALIGDSDFANIAGDLMNRYGESGVMTFSLIPQDAVMSVIAGAPAFEVLEQIQNSRCLTGVYYEYINLNPDPDTGIPRVQPDIFKVMQGAEGLPNQYLTVKAFVANQATATDAARGAFVADAIDSLLTVHDTPSAAKTMLITRFQNMIYGVEDALTEVSYWVEAAADLILDYEYCCFAPDGTYTVYMTTSARNEADAIVDSVLMKAKPFHYFPTIYCSNGKNFADLYGALDVIAPITVTQLKDINRVDLMSLFAVPDVGRVTGK